MTEGRSLMVDGSEIPPEPVFSAGRSGMEKRLRGGARRRDVAGGYRLDDRTGLAGGRRLGVCGGNADRRRAVGPFGGRLPTIPPFASGQVKAAACPACAAREAMDDRGKRKAGEAGFGSESRRAGDGLTQRGGNEAFGCAAGGRTGAEYGARLGLRSGACAAAGSGR